MPWEKVRNDIAVVIPVPKDKRSLFVVPWGRNDDGTFRHTYVGTTDTDYDGSLDDPQCTKDDIDYVLRALNASVTTGVTESDVTGMWAGLRPLVKRATLGSHRRPLAPAPRRPQRARRHHGHRRQADDLPRDGRGRGRRRARVARPRARVPHEAAPPARRRRATRRPQARRPTPTSPTATARCAAEIDALIDAQPSLGDVIAAGLPYLQAEVVYAARAEMARSVDDVLTRRTRARLLDRDRAIDAAPEVGRLLAAELGWDDAETQRQVAAFVESCRREEAAGRMPGPSPDTADPEAPETPATQSATPAAFTLESTAPGSGGNA